MLFLSCVCYAFVRVCLLLPCGHLLGMCWPLGSHLWCLDCIDSWSLLSFLLCNHLDEDERSGCFAWLSSWCLVIVEWLFPTMPWVWLQFMIVVFPDHTHLLFTMALKGIGYDEEMPQSQTAGQPTVLWGKDTDTSHQHYMIMTMKQSSQLSSSHWYPGSGVVLDWIDSRSLPYFLLWLKTRQFTMYCTTKQGPITKPPQTMGAVVNNT